MADASIGLLQYRNALKSALLLPMRAGVSSDFYKNHRD